MEKFVFSPLDGSRAFVTAYLHEPIYTLEEFTAGYECRKSYPAVIVCPGGAYSFVFSGEADPIALPYFAAGYNVYTLNYSTGEAAKDFTPLKELSAAIIKIRQNADKWRTEPNKIAVCGFSAGGHLAASAATMWDNKEFKKVFDTEDGLNKPNAAILSYPVITGDEFAHEESLCNVSGDKPGGERYKFFSLDKRVDKTCCPIFIWHTVEDEAVPVENTLKFVNSLQANGISYECHIFPHGCHGTGACTDEVGHLLPHNAKWLNLSIEWLNELFDFVQ